MAIITNTGATATANVDSTSNGLVVQNPKVVGQAGFVLAAAQVDDGTVTGTPLNRSIAITTGNRLEASLVSPLFTDTFNYAAQDSSRWNVALTTFTMGYAAGFMTLNLGSVTTAASVAMIKSYWTHPIPVEGALIFKMFGYQTQAAQTNCTTEFGFMYATGTATPTDGVFFRFDATGTLKGVINYNGSEITTAALTAPTPGAMARWGIVLDENHVEYWINGNLVATLNSATGTGQPMMSSSVIIGIRMFHAGSAPAVANQLKISIIDVWATDSNQNKPFATNRAEQGLVAYQGLSGMTMGSTALVANSANPTAAVPTNTTAALGSGLGGIFWETATLAVTPVDGIISSYQVPAATVNVGGRKLIITGISWNSIVQTVLAGGPFVYSHFLCFGHTSVSLATGEAAATKAPRRIALGVSTFATTAAVGTIGANFSRTFASPIVVNPGEFIATYVRQNGTVGTSGTIQHLITFDGYWS
jgi:hypothetical protein